LTMSEKVGRDCHLGEKKRDGRKHGTRRGSPPNTQLGGKGRSGLEETDRPKGHKKLPGAPGSMPGGGGGGGGGGVKWGARMIQPFDQASRKEQKKRFFRKIKAAFRAGRCQALKVRTLRKAIGQENESIKMVLKPGT